MGLGLLAVLCSVALAAGGTAGDPLISLSYLNNTYLPSLLSQVDNQIKNAYTDSNQSAVDSLEKVNTALKAQVNDSDSGWSYSENYNCDQYQQSDVIEISSGSQLLFLAGSAALSSDSDSVIDVSAGTELSAGAVLQANHRYLAGEGGNASVTVVSDAAFLGEMGQYKVSESSKKVTPFTDLVSSSWYYDAANYVYQNGLFNGVSANQFAPADLVTRSMVATVLYRQAGKPSASDVSASFSDVTAGTWYETPVKWASSCGVIKGVGENIFAPNSNVTREQIVVMLYRYLSDYMEKDVAAEGDLTKFTDQEKVSSWAKDGVSWAVGAGILTGRDDGTLNPGGSASRAEVAAIMQRFNTLLTK